MPNFTTNYNWYLPLVNDPTDEDLWGGYLNDNFISQDTIIYALASATPPTIPAGIVDQYAGGTVPSGWLECDGTAVSRTTYADLFTAIGTTYGIGDGTTTFNLPLTARRVIVGRGGTGTVTLANTTGSTGGEENHTLTTSETPSHRHFVVNSITATAAGVSNTTSVNASSAGGLGNQDYTLCSNGATADAGLSSVVGSDGGHNNIQPSLVMMFIIKT